jgi:hypothetical protein
MSEQGLPVCVRTYAKLIGMADRWIPNIFEKRCDVRRSPSRSRSAETEALRV